MSAKQVSSVIGESSTLTVKVNVSSDSYKVRLLPLQDSQVQTVKQHVATLQMSKIGPYHLELSGHSSTCRLLDLNLGCAPDHILRGTQCEKQAKTNLNKILGAILGTTLALCLVLLLSLVYKNPERMKRLFVSFMRREMRMALRIVFELCAFACSIACLQHVSMSDQSIH